MNSANGCNDARTPEPSPSGPTLLTSLLSISVTDTKAVLLAAAILRYQDWQQRQAQVGQQAKLRRRVRGKSVT